MADDSPMRNTAVDDLDDLTETMCSAMPMDPQWDYQFPKRLQYPEDNRSCTRRMMETFLSDVDKSHTLVRVITVLSHEEGKENKAVVPSRVGVAFH
jgi:hypothetical protein